MAPPEDAKGAHKAKLAALHARRERSAAHVQRTFRALLSRRAAHAARRLLIDEALLRRLSRLVARAEVRAAQLIQWKWRALHKSRKFRERVALKRVNHAVVRRRASKIVVELERRAQQELAEAKAAIRLQAALRRCVARRHAARAARTKAVGLLKMQWGANREVRAVGRLQRMWLARVAERREREASAQAGKLDQLQLRLARARSSELRAKHYAHLIARSLRTFARRRRAVVESLHGWLSKRSSSRSYTPRGWKWRRRYFWVSGGSLLYDSIKSDVEPCLRGAPIKELRSATHTAGREEEFCLGFGRGDVAPRVLLLRANSIEDARYWTASLLWLARLVDAPPGKPPAAALRKAKFQGSPSVAEARNGHGGDDGSGVGAPRPAPLMVALESQEASERAADEARGGAAGLLAAGVIRDSLAPTPRFTVDNPPPPPPRFTAENPPPPPPRPEPAAAARALTLAQEAQSPVPSSPGVLTI